MIIADTLSRAHISEEGEEIPEEELEAQIHMVIKHCVESDEMEEIKAATKDDETLQEVIKYTKEGWPRNRNIISEAAKIFTFYQEELSTHNDVLLKGGRIVVPNKLRRKILCNLHRSHMGIEKTKQWARTSVFWPGINTEVEESVRK